MALILDTSVAVELLEDNQRIIDRVAELDGQFLSVISRIELEAGVYRDGRLIDNRRARLDALVAKVEVLDFTSREVAAYSSVIAVRGFSRRLVADRMIAATAITHDLALATLNSRDFRGIPRPQNRGLVEPFLIIECRGPRRRTLNRGKLRRREQPKPGSSF